MARILCQLSRERVMKFGFLKQLTIIGPGILVAATGVGAGDLATGAFAGAQLGVAVVWAVVVGATLKFVINEGLARWQLVTGSTLLEGSVRYLGRPVQWVFLTYLSVWSFLVGAALMSACGAAGHAILPLTSAAQDKIIYGILHSLLALGLVKWGGYQLFEKIMSVCIGVMFIVVVTMAVALQPAWGEIASGLFVPTIPRWSSDGLQWTVALVGGVGGTLTVLCYGYWIREEQRSGPEWIPSCRIDLTVGYAMTALFGLSMVVIGSQIGEIQDAKGATLVLMLADRLRDTLGPLGPYARVAFMLGSWAAFFSSLLGVWQSTPYMFADVLNLMRQKEASDRRRVDVKGWPYQSFLWAIATVPALGLFADFKQIQKTYAIVGAMCIPLLAFVLLYLNGRQDLLGPRYVNSRLTRIMLTLALGFFVVAGGLEIRNQFFR